MYTIIKTNQNNFLMRNPIHLQCLEITITKHQEKLIENVYLSINLKKKWKKSKWLGLLAKSMNREANIVYVKKWNYQEKRLMSLRKK